MLKEGNHKSSIQFYTVSVRTFVITFYYGSGSSKPKSYVSYSSGSGSATMYWSRYNNILTNFDTESSELVFFLK